MQELRGGKVCANTGVSKNNTAMQKRDVKKDGRCSLFLFVEVIKLLVLEVRTIADPKLREPKFGGRLKFLIIIMLRSIMAY